MGPWGGFVTGLAETIEYVATTAVIVYFSAGYASGIVAELLGFEMAAWIWWIVLYAIFVVLNSAGSEISFKFSIVVAVMSIGILVVFAVMTLTSGLLNWDSLWNIPSDGGATSSTFLPFGVMGILFAIPFGVWLFLGIEALPLAAEEAHDPAKDIPKAGIWARGTLIATGLLVLFLNTAILGAQATGEAGEPLLDAFRVIVGDTWAAVLGLFALIGLLASLQGIMFAYGRNMYSLSRAGYYPRALSVTGKRQAPWAALLIGAVIGYISLVLIDANGGSGSPA
jgi:ethanolamine permease